MNTAATSRTASHLPLVLANLFEACFLVTLFAGRWIAAGFILHLAGAWLLRVAVITRSSPDDSRLARLAFPLGAFLPIFGIVGMTVLLLVLRLESRDRIRIIEEYHRHITSDTTIRPTFERIDVLEAARRELDVEPAIDILSARDTHQVWGSIETLSRQSDEGAVGMIRRTLDRPDMDVKFYSAWGLDRIDRRFRARRQLLEEKLAQAMEREPLSELFETFRHALRSRIYSGPLLRMLAQDALGWTEKARERFPGEISFDAYQALFLAEAGLPDASRTAFLRMIGNGSLPPDFLIDAAALFYTLREFSVVGELIALFASRPENEIHLVGRGCEATLDDLRAFWHRAEEAVP